MNTQTKRLGLSGLGYKQLTLPKRSCLPVWVLCLMHYSEKENTTKGRAGFTDTSAS